MISKTAAFLLAGLAGVAALLLGQAWDFYLHAADPSLAHREGIFAVTNPGHVLLGIGLPLVVVGVLGAAYTYFPLGPWGRRGFLASFAALILVSGAAAGWAASIELSSRQQLVTIASQQAGSLSHHPATAATLPNTAPTVVPVSAAQLEAAARLLHDTRAAVAKYRDQRVAVAAGYQPMESQDQQIVHFVNRAYFTDADVLKPQHVQSLIYYNSPKGPILIGAMYIMPKWGMSGPEIGGSLTTWHNHENLCFDNQTNMPVAFVGDPFFDREGWSRSCPKGSSKQDTPEMLHVWVVENPAGPFDSDMAPGDLPAIVSAPPAG